ncbi:ER lumen protein retaining receptor family protein isoform 1 [Hibiscus syriacus]|uniref:ER lumen protein retaining receptor family protein isoform 1 n=2 Tax=Hibiscus syriacus TaxID=106335 RepID=A0A6A2YR14_HIBSY|nr:ER lumen protein retaining receptor family protein isoform 1 [Hibiscus syriacus]
MLYNLWRRRTYRQYNSAGGGLLAPEPSGALPFIGHLHLLHTQRTGARTLAAIADKYGPVFTIRLGRFRALIISSREAVRDCFTVNDRVFANRPMSNAGTYLGYDEASFGFASYGPYWREIRKLVVVELLSVHKIGLLKHVQVSEVNAFIKHLYLFANKNEQVPNQKISMSQRLEALIVNMMVRMIAGKRYSSAPDGEADEEAQRVIKFIKEFSSVVATVTTVSEVVPFLKWMDKWSSQVKSMKRISTEMESLIETWIDEHKLKNPKTTANNNDDDQNFIHVMLSKIKDDDESIYGHRRENIIKATITMLIAAGIETTAIAMTWMLSNLMNNRHALKRAQQELDLKIGRRRWAEESDMEELVYLQAIIKETLRLYPPAPLLIPHVPMEDCCVGGYRIPKGTRLFVNAWKLHRDPRIWSNPEEFEPERFLTNHENVDVLGQNFELVSFGSGRRSCPGTNWALQAIRLTMARLLQGFDLKTPLNAPVDMTEDQSASATMTKATPLQLVLTPRLPHHLYQL